MIPKIIHFCWLSNDDYPKLTKKCIESWKKKLPDYEFMLWDTEKFDINSTLWTKQAYETGKYAFAADYIRLHAINTYGGIYFDSDVEVLKSFNDLLHLPYFIGSQCDGFIEPAVFGAHKGADWIQHCLEYYHDRAFIKKDGSLDQEILPVLMQSIIEKSKKIVQLNINEIASIESLISDKTALFLFPYEYFSPKNHQTRELFKSEHTYAIHHYNHSWFSLTNVLRLEVIKLIGLEWTEKIIGVFNLRKLRASLKSSKNIK